MDIELAVEPVDQKEDLGTNADGKTEQGEEEKAVESPEMEPVKPKEEVWLDSNEFLILLKETAFRMPLSFLNRLFSEFGYDFHLHRNHFLSVEDCWEALHDAQACDEVDRQLIQYLELILITTPDVTRLADLRSSHVLPISPEHANAVSFNRLIDRDTRVLRLRAEMLKLFNQAMVQSYPLVDFNGRGVIAALLSKHRHLLLSAGKLDFFYDILERTSVEGNQPTVNLNRVKIASGKSKLESKLQIDPLKSSDAASSATSVPSPAKNGDHDVEAILKDSDDWMVKNTIFGVAYAQLAKTDPQLYRQRKPTGHNPHYSINILFQGENVEGNAASYKAYFLTVRNWRPLSPVLHRCGERASGLPPLHATPHALPKLPQRHGSRAGSVCHQVCLKESAAFR